MKILDWLKPLSIISEKTEESGPGQPAQHYRLPSAEIATSRTGVLLEIDMPGVPEEEIDLAIGNGHLTASGKREHWFWPTSYYRMDLEMLDEAKAVAIESEIEDGKIFLHLQTSVEDDPIRFHLELPKDH